MTPDKALLEAMARAMCANDRTRPCMGCPDGCEGPIDYLQREGYYDGAQSALSAAEAQGWVLERASALREATMAERARCADIARTFAEVNLEMAGDSVIADPILSGEPLTKAAIRKSDGLVIDGCIHSSMYHAANNIATAIEKEPGANG